MEDENSNLNEKKQFTPTYVYDSNLDHPNYFAKENFIKFLKVVPNQKEVLVISNKNNIILYRNNNSNDSLSTNVVFNKQESHHIYDLDM